MLDRDLVRKGRNRSAQHRSLFQNEFIVVVGVDEERRDQILKGKNKVFLVAEFLFSQFP